MSDCRVSLDFELSGLRTLLLENDLIRITILLDRGGNIYEYVLKSENCDFLFHHPRVKPNPPVLGTAGGIDNWWFGGIDEILPTAFPSTYRGEEYPVEGELWAQKYSCEILKQSADEVEAYLSTHTTISPFKVEKWIKLVAGEPRLRIRTRITNTGYRDFHFLWGYHSTFAVTPDHRIDMPAGKMLVEDLVPESRFQPGTVYNWPMAIDKSGQKVDVSRPLEPSAFIDEYHYTTELKEGWYAVTDSKEKRGIGMSFPRETLSRIHLWLNYGFFRGCYAIGLYAMTGYPAALHKAIEQGTCSRLDAGKSLECEVSYVAYTGLARVSHIDGNGKAS